MIRTAAALFSVALIVCAASAQSPEPNQSGQTFIPGRMVTTSPDGQQKTTIVMIPIMNLCPVSMQAKQGGLTEMIRTGQKPQEPQQYDPSPKPTQHIHLILKGFAKDKRVSTAIVTARGLSARTRMQNTEAMRGQTPSDIRRTLQVPLTPDRDGSFSAYIDLPAFTAVNSIRLDSISYADGSSWAPENQNLCTVAPDPMMLIAGR